MEAATFAKPETHFEVDMMILDYLCCKGIQAILRARIAERKEEQHKEDIDSCISLFDTFKCIASINHSRRPISRDLEIKLQLLTFAVLFFHRYRHSAWNKSASELGRWRNQNAQSARNWLKAEYDKPKVEQSSQQVSQTVLDGNYQKMLSELKIPVQSRLLDRRLVMPLLDILPDFMALCAMAAPILPAEESMELAAQFMLQASLEQYLVFGRASSDVIDEAFAWGSPDAGNVNPETNADDDVDDACIWWRKRAKYIRHLQPNPGESLDTRLQNASRDFSVSQFEGMVIDFLHGLLTKLEIPTLVQLEIGGLAELGIID
ncbi:hypothetical protein VTN77DRAFT_9179 [Rasamsonia byssochlamydoides]|uniref:uncharacterized protein n=1 Tax=Rasamsonia byssochlamydoides TaxID=89139 RepID=UPI00374483BE